MSWWSYIPLIGGIIERGQENARLRLENKQKQLELERIKAEHAKCPVQAPHKD